MLMRVFRKHKAKADMQECLACMTVLLLPTDNIASGLFRASHSRSNDDTKSPKRI